MKTKINNSVWTIIVLFGLLLACQDDNLEPNTIDLSEHQVFLKELSILLGRAISDPNDRDELKIWMERAD
ncbi:MAG: hypothetical protein ABR597_14345, partial [Bacteroidales bacterium]